MPAEEHVEAANDTTSVSEDTTNNVINVLANDIGPAGSTLTVVTITQGTHGSVMIGPEDADVLYTPNPNFAGTDTFSYTVSNGTDTATATVTITVVNVDIDIEGTSGDDVFLLRLDATGRSAGLCERCRNGDAHLHGTRGFAHAAGV